jgi:hypothetical protein
MKHVEVVYGSYMIFKVVTVHLLVIETKYKNNV